MTPSIVKEEGEEEGEGGEGKREGEEVRVVVERGRGGERTTKWVWRKEIKRSISCMVVI